MLNMNQTQHRILPPTSCDVGQHNPRFSLLAMFQSLEKPLPTMDLIIPAGFEEKRTWTLESPDSELNDKRDKENSLGKPQSWLGRVTTVLSKWANQPTQHRSIRNLCIGTLGSSWVVSIALIVLSTRIVDQTQPIPSFVADKWVQANIYSECFNGPVWWFSHYLVPATWTTSFFIPLLFNVIITAMLDAHNRIHASTLRWTRHREERPLRYNTIQGLFSTTKSFGPCHWTVDIVSGIATCVTYGATATSVSTIDIVAVCNDQDAVLSQTFNGPHNGLDIAGCSLLILGVALSVQNIISTWKLLCHAKQEKSWSSDPITNAKVWAEYCSLQPPHQAFIEGIEGRQSVYRQIPAVRHFGRGLWALFALFVIAVIVVTIFANLTLTGVRYYGPGTTRSIDIWQYFGIVHVVLGSTSAVTDYFTPLVQSAMQAPLTAGLHCLDIVVSFLNDEDSWQDALETFNSTLAVGEFRPTVRLLKWRIVLAFVLKVMTQWMFGSMPGFHFYFTLPLLPLVTLSASILLTTLAVEIIGRRKSRRAGPTTYGDLHLLMRLIRDMEGLRKD